MAIGVQSAAGQASETVTLETLASNELTRMPEEPLLTIEKKLIGYSLTLGVVLMAILVWLSYSFFKG